MDAIDAHIEIWRKRWQTYRHVMSASSLVLLALTALEIKPLFQAFDETYYIMHLFDKSNMTYIF